MGGSGSGRKPDVLNMVQRQAEQRQPIAPEIFLPNLAGVKEEARKRSPVDITAGGGAETDPIFLALSGSFFTAFSDVDHDATTNFVADEHLDWKTDRGANNIHVNNITAVPEDAVTAHVAAIDHDSCLNFLANEHLDWTTDRGATNIHANNYTDTNTQLSDGDIAGFGYIKTYTETDPVFLSLSGSIPETDPIFLALSGGFLTAETDPMSGSYLKTAMSGSWNSHVADNTQAHSDYLLNNANDTSTGTITAAGFTTTGVTLTGDHGTAATDQVVNVCYGTGDPPAANTTTEGALFVKYTA